LKKGELREAWNEIGTFTAFHGGSDVKLCLSVVRHLMQVALRQVATYQRLARWKNHRAARRDPWFTTELSEHVDIDGHQITDWSLDGILRQSVERGPLPSYLRSEDRNSMAHSVEARLLFLDYRLVSLVFRCAAQWKMRGPWNKYLLREAMRQRIPESVRTRVDKMGFPVPQGKWISGAWYELLQVLLESRDMRERGIYNLAEIHRDLDLHRHGKKNVSGKLFSVVQLELWSRKQKSLGGLAA